MTGRRVERRVSIVVLNWNSGALGAAAVRSALAQDWPDVEVIVVDNASEDDSLAEILTVAPDLTVVRNATNVGFGAGMNAGLAVATGEFVLPLNCDATLEYDYVRLLVAVLDADPALAGAGGLVGSDRVGATGPTRITPMMRTAAMPTDRACRCDKVNGACPLLRARALDDVVALGGGPYDGSYFVYGEDVDLALTLRRLGWGYAFDPAARADHVRSFGSAPRLADRRGRLRTSTLHNRHRNIVRHGRSPWGALTVFALVQDVGFAILRMVRGDLAVVADVGRSWRRLGASIPSDLRRRRQLRAGTKLG